MMTLATVLGLTSGLALMRYNQGPAELIATSLLVDAMLAPVTATIAARRGRSATVWAVLGFLFGMWALAASLLMRAARPKGETPPANGPTSDAA